jgi:hypothetical protein
MADRFGLSPRCGFKHGDPLPDEEGVRVIEVGQEYQRIRSVLMHAIGFIEGLAIGLEVIAPSDVDQKHIAERLRETAIELREQT